MSDKFVYVCNIMLVGGEKETVYGYSVINHKMGLIYLVSTEMRKTY